MLGHVRSGLLLLVLTVVLCCLVYPLMLLGIGQLAFRDKAQGSLVGADGKPAAEEAGVGSRLIAQPFRGDEYFKPRPSAASYNGAASGGSNWGANNPLLRDRVARQLGPIAKYKDGRPVGPDIEAWFLSQVKGDAQKKVEDRFVVRWASDHSALAEQWIKDNVDAVAAELGKEAPAVKDATADTVPVFFKHFAEKHPGQWPTTDEQKDAAGQAVKVIKPVQTGGDVQAYFFDLWLHDHPRAELKEVPADMVMASGSGLDPHITRKNADYQLDDVADAWAKKTKRDVDTIRKEIRAILDEKSESPLNGLVGVPLVNVLEVNLAMRNHFGAVVAAGP
jgi:K+-transporting ATPase ATPase C chain